MRRKINFLFAVFVMLVVCLLFVGAVYGKDTREQVVPDGQPKIDKFVLFSWDVNTPLYGIGNILYDGGKAKIDSLAGEWQKNVRQTILFELKDGAEVIASVDIDLNIIVHNKEKYNPDKLKTALFLTMVSRQQSQKR